jgi:drug/metabolite transporter (DMT)-like permease
MPSALDIASSRLDAARRSAGLVPWLALGAVYVIWGSTYAAIRVGVEHMPPFVMGGVRYLIAGALLYPFAQRGSARPRRRHWLWAAFVACTMLVGGNGLVNVGEQTVPSGVASLLVATVPLWLVVIDLAGGGPRLRLVIWAGLAVGFAGVALLVRPGGGWEAAGAALIVAAAVFWALGSAFSRGDRLPPRALVALAARLRALDAVARAAVEAASTAIVLIAAPPRCAASASG